MIVRIGNKTIIGTRKAQIISIAIFLVIATVCAAVLMSLAIAKLRLSARFANEGIETTAMIKSKTLNGDIYTGYVEYEVDGEVINSYVKWDTRSVNIVGDRMWIIYLESEPCTIIRSGENVSNGIASMIVGAVISLVFAIAFTTAIIKEYRMLCEFGDYSKDYRRFLAMTDNEQDALSEDDLSSFELSDIERQVIAQVHTLRIDHIEREASFDENLKRDICIEDDRGVQSIMDNNKHSDEYSDEYREFDNSVGNTDR